MTSRGTLVVSSPSTSSSCSSLMWPLVALPASGVASAVGPPGSARGAPRPLQRARSRSQFSSRQVTPSISKRRIEQAQSESEVKFSAGFPCACAGSTREGRRRFCCCYGCSGSLAGRGGSAANARGRPRARLGQICRIQFNGERSRGKPGERVAFSQHLASPQTTSSHASRHCGHLGSRPALQSIASSRGANARLNCRDATCAPDRRSSDESASSDELNTCE